MPPRGGASFAQPALRLELLFLLSHICGIVAALCLLVPRVVSRCLCVVVCIMIASALRGRLRLLQLFRYRWLSRQRPPALGRSRHSPPVETMEMKVLNRAFFVYWYETVLYNRSMANGHTRTSVHYREQRREAANGSDWSRMRHSGGKLRIGPKETCGVKATTNFN